jgi:peptide/nickel transport system ATP-binding protein
VSEAARSAQSTPLLTIRNLAVSFVHQHRRVVSGIDLTVRQAEIVGLVGESGSGKTMTALASMGLLPHGAQVVEGSIDFLGRDMLQLSPSELRAIRGDRLAMIFQDPMSFTNPLLRVRDQVGEPLVVHRAAGWREARAKAVDLLRQVHIPGAAERGRAYPHEFSGGMLQRASLAAALACEPALIIADEPTTALDVTIQAEVLELLREIRERHGTAILLITHDLGVVADLCDSMVVMYAGRIMEEGPVAAVFDRPAHPYTEALLRATPRIDGDVEIEPIGGQTSVAAGVETGCRFRDRCPHRFDRCIEEPGMIEIGADRRSRCWLEDAGT